MPPIAAAAIAIAPAVAAGVGVYSIVEGRRQAKEAESAAEKYSQMQWEQTERQAGEYFDLTQKQMELQAQSQNITTLVDLITARSGQESAPRILTLPQPQTLSPVAQLNAAIDRLFRAA